MEPVVTMEEVYFFGQLLFYMKANHPEALKLMIDSGVAAVAETAEQIAQGDR